MKIQVSVVLSIALLATSFASASVFTLTGGVVDTRASAVSGKQGSSSGQVLDDPAATSILSGQVTNSLAIAEAGPVPPGTIVTLPGTSGVATGTGIASVDTTTANVFEMLVNVSNSFVFLDGGSYLGNANARSAIEFTVSSPVDYAVTASFSVDPGDLLWKLQLSGGPDAFLFNNATDTADSGTLSASGTLQPEFTYTLQSSVGISDVVTEGNVAGVLSSSTIETTFTAENLTVIPEPSATAFLAALGVVLFSVRRRRRSL